MQFILNIFKMWEFMSMVFSKKISFFAYSFFNAFYKSINSYKNKNIFNNIKNSAISNLILWNF
ncbi:Uncharacterised protein [Mesomycoplasma ovipneumoniae]|nr:Uncharacterised protein [Mesomycoplasma ovipneumoniae]